MPLYLEFTLSFLLDRADAWQPFAHRRLNAFENTLTDLARKWRPRLPLAPAQEIRMCEETREALLAWIESDDAARGHTLQRLAVYAAAVTDDNVPEGWVRLNLRAEAGLATRP